MIPKINKSIGSRILSNLEADVLGFKGDKRNKLIQLDFKGEKIVINKLILGEKLSGEYLCEKLGFQLVTDDGKPAQKKIKT
jgi:hypothetical protein